MANDTPRPKGQFGSLKLPLAKRYLYPAGRNRLLLFGVALAVFAVVVLFASIRFDQSRLISKGPLSSAHANLEGNCLSCHAAAGGGISDQKCSLCHEKSATGVGLHTLPAHYVYVSGDR